jgi:hypothetical protein
VLAFCCSERDSLEFKELNSGRSKRTPDPLDAFEVDDPAGFPTIRFAKTIQESL